MRRDDPEVARLCKCLIKEGIAKRKDTLKVLADRLEELGDSTYLTIRWMIDYDRWPHIVIAHGGWHAQWHTFTQKTYLGLSQSYKRSMLPDYICDLIVSNIRAMNKSDAAIGTIIKLHEGLTHIWVNSIPEIGISDEALRLLKGDSV